MPTWKHVNIVLNCKTVLTLIRGLHCLMRYYELLMILVLLDVLVPVRAAPHECVIRTGLP